MKLRKEEGKVRETEVGERKEKGTEKRKKRKGKE